MRWILVVEDDLLMREFLIEGLSEKYRVRAVGTGREAIKEIEARSYALILLDIRLPDINGIELLKKIKDYDSSSIVTMMTAHGTVESAVEAMKIGAYHYIKKPFTIEEIEIVINKALEFNHLQKENKYLRSQVQSKFGFFNIIGRSKPILEIFEIVKTVAQSHSTVLIEAETGTGKELIAKAVHYNGENSNGPFIKVNCAALPRELLESELFGHEKGAFTGADKRVIGKFEVADGGTILLDEISEIDPSVQAKLLRVIQEKEFYRVGGNKIVKTNARVICTTNRNIKKEVEEGRFREDLYYRLNVVPIFIPPLRDRKEDIPILIDHFLKKYNKENGKEVEITEEAIKYLANFSWPGNVRELENCIERSVVMARVKVLGVESFLIPDEEKDHGKIPIKVGVTLREAEKQLLLKTLEECKGNRTRASQMLGVSIRTIRNKLKEYSDEERI